MNKLIENFPFVFGVLFFGTEIYRNFALKSNNKNATATDKNSLKILWITIFLSIFAGGFALNLVFANYTIFQPALAFFGIFIAIAGFILRAVSIHQLGKEFTVDVQINSDHQLKQDGLYAYVRNPSYTGALMSFLGLAISYSNWISLLVIIIPIFFAFSYRISIEEKALQQAFGDSFTEYCKKTKRLIPFIY